MAVIDEARQARIYADVVRTLGCDRSVSSIDFFHVIDNRDLIHYQSGLLRADGSERPSFAAVRNAVAAPCTAPKPWRHETSVLSASASFTPGAHPTSAADLKLRIGAAEDADVTVAILRAAGPVSRGAAERALAGTGSNPAVVGSGKTFVKGGRSIPVAFNGAARAGPVRRRRSDDGGDESGPGDDGGQRAVRRLRALSPKRLGRRLARSVPGA